MLAVEFVIGLLVLAFIGGMLFRWATGPRKEKTDNDNEKGNIAGG